MSTEYGWAANNVVDFEIVLANGTIANANANSNQDLFAVLKGGGNNFGIVTTYTLKAYPQGQVCGTHWYLW
jgi:FAD/FMN-containing dehydrogenase